MYPFVRMLKERWKYRNAPALKVGEAHVSHHICWPHDLDPWLELNNGRTLTFFDLGRIPAVRRLGLTRVTEANGWRMTVAGNSIRYRRRVVVFERLEMRSRVLGWDHRFFYFEQSMWKRNGECANHGLYRMAITGPDGIVEPPRAFDLMGQGRVSPPLPEWVAAWIDADGQRQWPPAR